ncbi:membrane protein [soil metagenome]
MARPTATHALTGILAGAGVMHFVKPEFFDAIVPSLLPNPRFWTNVSGVAELAVAAAVATPATRRHGATAAAVLFVAVFPANIQGAFDAKPGVERAVTLLRLPLQIPLIRLALKIRKQAAG